MTIEALKESDARGATPDQQQRIVEADQRERAARAQSLLRKLETMGEQADWFGRALDMGEEFQFGSGAYVGMGGYLLDRQTAEGFAFIYPGATAPFYINEVQLKGIRARSRAFVRDNPFWLGVKENRISYIVGVGHTWTITAKQDKDPAVTPELIGQIKTEIETFVTKNRYTERQEEKTIRKDRDGEYFLRLFDDHPDGVLRVRFVEPLLVANPPGKDNAGHDVWFGVQFAGDYEDPMGYWVRQGNYLGTRAATDHQNARKAQQDAQAPSSVPDGWDYVPAADMQHRKVNVDISSPRGVPTTYAIQARLDQAIKTLTAMGRIVHFREKIALIRKHVNATASTVKTLLQDKPTVAGPGRQPMTIEQLPDSAVLDINDQSDYQFPTQNTEVEKIVASIQADLRSVAAALGLAEYLVSADASNANFASTMVAEGPVVKGFERQQARIVEEDIEILARALALSESRGRLPAGIVAKIKINAATPQLISRNRLQDTQSDEILNRNKVLSRSTWAARNQLDIDEEREKIDLERDADAAYSLDDDLGSDALDGKDADLFGLPQTLKPDPSSAWLEPTGEGVREGMAQATTVIEVPDIRQPDHFSCGACAAMAVGRHFSVGPGALEDWKKALGTSLEKSTHPQAIVDYLASLGLDVQPRENMTLADLALAVAAGRPVISPVQDYGNRRQAGASFAYGHYLTVIGVIPGYVICQDSSIENVERKPGGDVPASQADQSDNIEAPGRILIRQEDWTAVWHDQDADGRRFVHFGIIVGKKQDVTQPA